MIESSPFGLEVTPDHPCDRCTHTLGRHAPADFHDDEDRWVGTVCRVKRCLCDGYVAKGAAPFEVSS